MPSSRKSPSRRRAIPSARETRSPVSTFLRTVSLMGMETQLRDPRDEAEGVGAAKELPQPRRFGVSQAVSDVRPEVGLVLRLVPGAVAIVALRDGPDGSHALPQRLLEAPHFRRRHDAARP